MATSKKYDRLSVSVTGYLKKTVTEKAEKKGVSISTYIKDLIKHDLKKV